MYHMKLKNFHKYDTELEYFIKGLIKSYKNKTPPIDKSIIYEKNSKYFIKTTEKKDQKGKYTFTNKPNKYTQSPIPNPHLNI